MLAYQILLCSRRYFIHVTSKMCYLSKDYSLMNSFKAQTPASIIFESLMVVWLPLENGQQPAVVTESKQNEVSVVSLWALSQLKRVMSFMLPAPVSYTFLGTSCLMSPSAAQSPPDGNYTKIIWLFTLCSVIYILSMQCLNILVA